MDQAGDGLALWTPVAVSAGPGGTAIDWGDLRGRRFDEPFFHQTVERWAGDDPAPLVRTGLEALRALDGAPSLDPAALIFHVSRCGSTLLSRLLGCVPGVLAVSEPAPLNALLLAEPAALAGEDPAEAIRLLVRALGRRRFGNEHHYILKLSSWNVTRLALFRRAFPSAAVIWLGRAPQDVVASLLADPPGWLALRDDPAAARAAFGIDRPAPDLPGFCIQAVTALLEAAAQIEGPALFLDYADLPQAAWAGVAPFLGIDLDDPEIARMRDLARYQAKETVPRPFAATAPERAKLSPEVRTLVDQAAGALSRDLAARRRL